MSRKFILTVTLVALTVGAGQVNAQEKMITFGVKAGANLSTFGGDINNTKSVIKYQIGVTTDIALTENLYVLTGLDFQTKGAKYKPKSGSSIKYNPMYLQLPVHIAYKLEVLPGAKLVLNAGSYIAYGIGGKAKGDGESQKIFADNKFNRLDYGVGGGVGFEFSRFCISGGYDLGLKNISDTKGVKVKNRNAYLTLGVKF